MLAKCLFINPHPSPDPQTLAIFADTSALEAMRDAISEAIEGGPEGAIARAEVTELESRRTVTYKFVRFPDDLIRAMKAEEN